MGSRTGGAKPTRPPATTPEGREKQLIADAYELAERQIRAGTASAQVITHFLKLGTDREKLERKKLELDGKLLEAKANQIASSGQTEKLYNDAIAAFTTYKSTEVPDEILED